MSRIKRIISIFFVSLMMGTVLCGCETQENENREEVGKVESFLEVEGIRYNLPFRFVELEDIGFDMSGCQDEVLEEGKYHYIEIEKDGIKYHMTVYNQNQTSSSIKECLVFSMGLTCIEGHGANTSIFKNVTCNTSEKSVKQICENYDYTMSEADGIHNYRVVVAGVDEKSHGITIDKNGKVMGLTVSNTDFSEIYNISKSEEEKTNVEAELEEQFESINPFEYVTVTFEGFSPVLTYIIDVDKTTNPAMENIEFSFDKATYSNGMVANLKATIVGIAEKEFKEKYGAVLEVYEKEFYIDDYPVLTDICVNDYFKFELTGWEDSAFLDVSYDSDKFDTIYGASIESIFAEIESQDVIELLEKSDLTLTKALLFASVRPKMEDNSKLSNGDIVKVSWEIDNKVANQLGYNFVGKEFDYEVNDLVDNKVAKIYCPKDTFCTITVITKNGVYAREQEIKLTTDSDRRVLFLFPGQRTKDGRQYRTQIYNEEEIWILKIDNKEILNGNYDIILEGCELIELDDE